MITAEEINEKTDIGIHIVRYRLTELRRTGKMRGARLCGNTYVYPDSAVKAVRDFGKGK